MGEELSILWILLGIGILLIGPASGVWSGLKINGVSQKLDLLSKQWDGEREDIRSWLGKLQTKTQENEKEIGEVVAVMKDRKDRS
ncbi:MAG: hypothetical protein V3T23_10180 [Nitrososphaerales archaeon]